MGNKNTPVRPEGSSGIGRVQTKKKNRNGPRLKRALKKAATETGWEKKRRVELKQKAAGLQEGKWNLEGCHLTSTRGAERELGNSTGHQRSGRGLREKKNISSWKGSGGTTLEPIILGGVVFTKHQLVVAWK